MNKIIFILFLILHFTNEIYGQKEFIVTSCKFKGFAWAGSASLQQMREGNYLALNLYLIRVLNDEDTSAYYLFSKYGVGYNYKDTFYASNFEEELISKNINSDKELFVEKLNLISRSEGLYQFYLKSSEILSYDNLIELHRGEINNKPDSFIIKKERTLHEDYAQILSFLNDLQINKSVPFYYSLLKQKLLHSLLQGYEYDGRSYIEYHKDYSAFYNNEFELRRRRAEIDSAITAKLSTKNFLLGPFVIIKEMPCSEYHFDKGYFILRDFADNHNGYNISKLSPTRNGYIFIEGVNALDFHKIYFPENEAESILKFTDHNPMYGREIKVAIEYILLPFANYSYDGEAKITDPDPKKYWITTLNAYISKIHILEGSINKIIYTIDAKTKLNLDNFYQTSKQ